MRSRSLLAASLGNEELTDEGEEQVELAHQVHEEYRAKHRHEQPG
ncbi:MAG TPA: hypothetical protein VE441_00410 [Mycobacterium sp.]|nr:hypothetical protein [Mycobacterium sp.]